MIETMSGIGTHEMVFIINPNSGNGRIGSIIKAIREVDHQLAYYVTTGKDSFTELMKEIIHRFRVFIMVGGDGTVHAGIDQLSNYRDKIFGVIPNGSGNGFAYEMGFKRDIKAFIEDIKRGETVDVDVLEINGYKCVNVAGLGLDSYVAHRFQESKKRGLLNYIKITVQSLLHFRPFYAKITYSKGVVEGKFQMISIANTRQFGNNAFIAPNARPNDGRFDLVLVKPIPFYLYPEFVFRMFTGSLKENRYLNFIQSDSEVLIESGLKELHVDGEPVEMQKVIKINTADNKIKVVKTAHNKLA